MPLKIGLVDVDGHNFPNLPLMKLSASHKKQGDTVEMFVPLSEYDIVYKSKVFTHTPDIDYQPKAELIYEGGIFLIYVLKVRKYTSIKSK